jgi:hypothetical protein
LALGHQHQLYEYSTCNVIQGFTIWDVRPRFLLPIFYVVRVPLWVGNNHQFSNEKL